MTRRWMLLLCVVFVFAALAGVSPADAEPIDRAECEQLLNEGLDLFRKADETARTDPETASELYSHAILRFERIVRDGGVRNGKLYYDIGNAYYRKGDIGHAILNYRIAQQFIPNDPNLKQNLAAALRRCKDSIPENQETRVVKTLFFWHYDLSARVRAIIFVVSFATLCAFACIRLFAKRPAITALLCVSAVIAGLFFGSLVTEEIRHNCNVFAVVTDDEIVARKGDGETYQPSFTEPLHAGTEVRLIENRGSWDYVELCDGRRCWLPRKCLGLIR